MKGVNTMTGFIRAKEVCELLQCSSAMAYRIIARLNEELESKGYITISGRISKDYLCERMGIKNEQQRGTDSDDSARHEAD